MRRDDEPEFEPEEPDLDWDTCPYIGDGEAGCHYGAVYDGNGWFSKVDVDCEHFTDSLSTVGPWPTESVALQDAHARARAWCLENDVKLQVEF